MFTEHDMHRARADYQALRRDAEVARLVRASRAERDHATGWHCCLLAGLGTLLIDWGTRLRARYGTIELSNDARPPRHV